MCIEPSGVIAFRDFNHITLFFVKEEYQRKGIGRALFQKALEIAQVENISVHSSPFAVECYKSLGFKVLDAEKVELGIRYIPMEYLV